MELRFGSAVYTSDEREAGSLHRVVVAPDTKEVTHVVILRGLIVKDDKVIPVERITSADQEKINLDCTLEEVAEMSPLELEVDLPVTGTAARRQVVDPLVAGGAAWNPPPQPSSILEVRRTIPEELVALKDGARVLSDEEDLVGSIECVTTAPDSRTVTHFTIAQGLLFKTRKYIPIQWVEMLGEDGVRLAVRAQQVDDLPADQD